MSRSGDRAEGLRVGVILAAGASSRMGQPKALLRDERGATFLERLARTLRSGGCDAVIAVAGRHVAEIAAALPSGVLLACNADWMRGQLSSAKVGLRAALDLRPERIVLHLVDQPLIRPADVRRVLEADVELAIAARRGEPGHPIALGPGLARAIATDRRSETLREALERHVGPPRLIECSAGCVRGANDPRELAALLRDR